MFVCDKLYNVDAGSPLKSYKAPAYPLGTGYVGHTAGDGYGNGYVVTHLAWHIDTNNISIVVIVIYLTTTGTIKCAFRVIADEQTEPGWNKTP